MFSADRRAEQERLLRNEADLAPQVRRDRARAGRCRPAAPRPPWDPSAAASGSPACSCPRRCGPRPPPSRRRESADSTRSSARRVPYSTVTPRNSISPRTGSGNCSGSAGAAMVGLLVQNLVDARQRRRPALHQVHHPAQRDHRPHQHAHVGVEHDEAAQRRCGRSAPGSRPPRAPPGR